ncbi:hypothetical protein Cob_v007669 [Colletotrichum orbiculare MAFF 240422]|uniref:Uncharacterized protein n=1 Tax=Colletotrichum orbiculare (strain 104-T / ATCC 96160 / CBS 514.97 / LARS 414 / MAFF 240422) TaxID=1213857 RepID=A0A484FPC8_COLOR|nr:hypothetical protein Cob_v007669 [Colletotrichum orbiculare MAFF 240422]
MPEAPSRSNRSVVSHSSSAAAIRTSESFDLKRTTPMDEESPGKTPAPQRTEGRKSQRPVKRTRGRPRRRSTSSVLGRLDTDGISKALERKHKSLSRDELQGILPSELPASAYDQGWDREDEARLRTMWEEDMKRDDISRYTHHCMPKLMRACLCFFRESPFDVTSEKNLLRMATAKWQTRLCMSLYDLIPHPLWDSHWELRDTAVQPINGHHKEVRTRMKQRSLTPALFSVPPQPGETVDTDRRRRLTTTDGPPRFYVVTPKDLANITDALDGT